MSDLRGSLLAVDSVVVDGVAVQIDGEGEDVLLMIHGWPDTHRLWDEQVAAFRSHFRCVRFTLPGFERGSGRVAYSLEHIVSLVAHIADAVSPARPVTLMVHDWGCLFGYQYVLDHPQRVSRLIGLDIGDAGSRAHRQSLSPRQQAMTAGYQLALALAWSMPARLGDAITRHVARWARAPGDSASIGAWMNYPYRLLWSGHYRDASRRMRGFLPPCPMLFVYGRRKPFMFHSEPWLQALSAQPGSKVVALSTGHWLMRDPSFNRIVAEWLGGPFSPACGSSGSETCSAHGPA
jgi:pimeloyl-ACP methyl ester carboxylesterase